MDIKQVTFEAEFKETIQEIDFKGDFLLQLFEGGDSQLLAGGFFIFLIIPEEVYDDIRKIGFPLIILDRAASSPFINYARVNFESDRFALKIFLNFPKAFTPFILRTALKMMRQEIISLCREVRIEYNARLFQVDWLE